MDGSLTSKKIRQMWLDYFYAHEHDYRHSSSTIPHDDPTLLFANAGMNQFKPIFLGTVDPKTPMATWKRAVNSQKCIRAGGKHNDLDDVGKDTYHHTFFEMLGSWSFGNYFKKEAIPWAWELLTEVYKIPKDRLYATYFEGDPNSNPPLEADLESKALWQKFLPDDRILPGNAKDNFWEMGETGPCGPCSEIHYDRIGNRNAAHLVNMDDPDVLEIWNLVFMQFNRENDRSLKVLPGQHVDTGMGLERLVSVIQDKRSNYDTDMFMPLFDHIQKITGARPYQGKLGDEDEGGIDMAYRVLADHARTLTIALSDGGVPDNIGRGYVLRRILRRAVRYSQKLGAKPGDFASLVDIVQDVLGEAFPEINKDPDTIKEIINEEEVLFLRTLTRGQRILERKIASLPEGSKKLPGETAWILYDTFGFPQDLTALMAEEKGLELDCEGFEECKKKAIELSKQGGNKTEDTIALDVHSISQLQEENLKPTDASHKYNYTWNDSVKLYDLKPTNGKITRIRFDKQFQNSIDAQKVCGLILDQTNFYAEQGGQIYDIGAFYNKEGEEVFTVTDCQVKAGYVVHYGRTHVELSLGDEFTLTPDISAHRQPTMYNHTATHMLNHALREVLGEGTDQKGSLVAPDRLRFDFSNAKAMTAKQVEETEKIVNKMIEADKPVFYENVGLEKAMKIPGLRAMFGETYPDPVRVVSVGVPINDCLNLSEDCLKTSVEFCGGTHLHRSSHAKKMIITKEEAISKGIRRIEAVTGDEALKAEKNAARLNNQFKIMEDSIASGLKQNEDLSIITGFSKDIASFTKEIDNANIGSVAKVDLRDKNAKLKKTVDAQAKKIKTAKEANCTKLVDQAAENPGSYVILRLDDAFANGKVLSNCMNKFKKSQPEVPIMLISSDSDAGRVQVSCQVPKSQLSKIDAKSWVSQTSDLIKGKGGGKDVNAMASGTDTSRVEEAIEMAEKFAQLKFA